MKGTYTFRVTATTVDGASLVWPDPYASTNVWTLNSICGPNSASVTNFLADTTSLSDTQTVHIVGTSPSDPTGKLCTVCFKIDAISNVWAHPGYWDSLSPVDC